MSSVVVSTPQHAGASADTESIELFIRWQEQGDATAREELMEQFMPLARSLARRYGHSAEPFEDLLQVASLGLLKALDRFDPATRLRLPVVRRAHDSGRDAAVLPRLRLGRSHASRGAGAGAAGT